MIGFQNTSPRRTSLNTCGVPSDGLSPPCIRCKNATNSARVTWAFGAKVVCVLPTVIRLTHAHEIVSCSHPPRCTSSKGIFDLGSLQFDADATGNNTVAKRSITKKMEIALRNIFFFMIPQSPLIPYSFLFTQERLKIVTFCKHLS